MTIIKSVNKEVSSPVVSPLRNLEAAIGDFDFEVEVEQEYTEADNKWAVLSEDSPGGLDAAG